MQNILTEYIQLEYSPQMIVEAAGNNGIIRLKNATLQRANAKNQNGRIYPRHLLMREASAYQNEFVNQRRALGELDHPEATVVNLKNVSHNIVEMHWEGDDLKGTIEILSTPSGNIVKELMKNGIRLGVSSRGVGSVREVNEGVVEVDEDFKLICFDIVSNPSTHGAFINESVKLSLEQNRNIRINSLISDFISEIGQ